MLLKGLLRVGKLPLKRCMSSKIRNVGIMAHIDAGKTTTTERMLYYSGYISSVGEVHQGDTVMDYMDQERDRGITITSAAITFPWKDHQFNLIDTPGHVDFTLEVERALRVLDGGIVILDGSAGVQAQTVTVWRQARRNSIPKLIFINKMDKPNADLMACLQSVNLKFEVTPLLVQLPLGSGPDFRRLIDLISMEVLTWDKPSFGKVINSRPLDQTDVEYDEAVERRVTLIDQLCQYDDEMAEFLLENENYDTIPSKVVNNALRRITCDKDCPAIVTLLGSSYRNIGVQPLMDAVIKYLPCPMKSSTADGFVGMAFKIIHHPTKGDLTFVRIYQGKMREGDSIYNVNREKVEKIRKLMIAFADEFRNVKEVSVGNIAVVSGFKLSITGDTLTTASGNDGIQSLLGVKVPNPVMYCTIEPPTMAQHLQLEQALNNLSREDPSFRVSIDPDSGQTIVSGMGELHLEIIKDRILKEYKVDADLGNVMIAYKETALKSVEVVHEFSRTVLGKQYEVVVELRLDPMENRRYYDDEKNPILVINTKKHESLDNLRPWQLKALRNGFDFSVTSGPLLSSSVVGINFELLSISISKGTKDTIISAAIMDAVKSAMKKGDNRLLEPIMKLEILAESNVASQVVKDLILKRGNISDERTQSGNVTVIHAFVPLSELRGYSRHLRTMTSGKAFFGMELSHYELLDSNLEALAIEEVTGFSPI